MRNHKNYRMDWNSIRRITKKICHNEPIREVEEVDPQYKQQKALDAIQHYLDIARNDIDQFGEISEITLESLQLIINGIE